jgi:chromosome segregation ATPase
MSTALEALDTEIAQAERRAAEAFAQQRTMSPSLSTSEAIAQNRVCKALNAKVAELKSRRFEVVAGVEAPEPPPPPKLQEKLDWLDVRVQSVALASEKVQRSIAEGIASATATTLKAEHERMLAHVHDEKEKAIKLLRKEIDVVRHSYSQSATRTANKLMEMREVREQSQAEVERDILMCRRELADLRAELFSLKAAHGLVAAPFNGSRAHNNDNP